MFEDGFNRNSLREKISYHFSDKQNLFVNQQKFYNSNIIDSFAEIFLYKNSIFYIIIIARNADAHEH